MKRPPKDKAIDRPGEAGLPALAEDARRLLHDLQVQELELLMQNRELREAKDVLEDSRARYAALYDSAPVAYLTFDRRGTIREANLAACALLSTERRTLLERAFRMFLSRDSRKAFDDQLARCFATAAPVTGEVRVPFRGDERIIELVTAPSPESQEGGQVCHAAAIDVTLRARDTQRRAALFKIEQEARTLAEHASGMKEEFLAMVSHELRTPLVPMLLWLKVLETAPDDAELRTRGLQVIASCVRSQGALIDDLVDTARATFGKMKIERTPVDLAKIIEEVIDRSSPAASNQVQVRWAAEASSRLVLGDARRLSQVIGNLVSNAIKFSGQSGHVEISLRDEKGFVAVVIRDEGEGISADLLPSIFELFRQRESDEVRRHGGLGLGLFIARQIVALHGGTLEAESPGAGRGTTLTLRLPVATGPQGSTLNRDEPSTAHIVVPASEAALRLESLALLVVDDDPATREALKALFERQGATTTTAASAAQGRAAMTRARPDVLISDLSMPREDGYAFIRTLRSKEAATPTTGRLPALALTALVGPEQQERALEAGFDRYLAKPTEPDRLVTIVAQLAHAARRIESEP